MPDSINIYPVLATWKKSKKTGLCPLHISIDLNNKKVAFPSLKKKVKPEQWDEKGRKVKNNHPNAAVLNAYITKRVNELEAEYTKMQIFGNKLSRERVRRVLTGVSTGTDYYKFCKAQIEAKAYSPSTKKAYLAEITKMQGYSPEVLFSDFSYKFLQDYERYMRSELGNTDNTVWKTFKFHNTMLNDAIKLGGYIQDNPFDEYNRGRYKQGIPPYLEWHEFEALREAVIDKDKLNGLAKRVAYRFLLSCVSGLRFGDAMKFSYEKSVIKDRSGERLLLYAAKNGEIISIAFTDYIREIVEYLKMDESLSVTNQEYNRTLKLIASVAELKKPLSSHMGRHTFGMRCAELGLSMDDTQRLLGHRDRHSTAIYFKIKNPRLDKAMEAWNSKL